MEMWHTHTHTHTYTYTHTTHMNTHVCAHTRAHTRTHPYTHMCTHIHTHSHIHTHAQTHIHTCTMEYYSAVKKNVIMSFTATWMGLEIIILKRSQSERKRHVYHMVLIICGI